MQYEVENQAIDFQDLWYFQEIERQTGVHIQFEDIKDSEWETRLSLMFASGTYPDLILRGSLDVEEYGVSQHLVLPLDGYMDEGKLPNYTAKMNQETRERLTSSDGHIYQLGFLISQNVNTSGHLNSPSGTSYKPLSTSDLISSFVNSSLNDILVSSFESRKTMCETPQGKSP